MTFRSLRNTELKYHLISYDSKCRERADDPDSPTGLMSDEVLKTLEREPISDVFILSHGWMNDFEGAIRSYNQWIGAMLQCEEDLQAIRQIRPGFRPLLIGVHWPSKPFGNEDLSTDVSFSASAQSSLHDLVEQAAESIADTPAARAALQTIFASALDDMAPDEMPAEVVNAYKTLSNEAGLSLSGLSAAPGEDGELFDPESLYEEELDGALSFGGGLIGGLLAPLRPLSFWKMKKRGRKFGEGSGGLLLRELQRRSDADVKFHLMGHSFGCVVVSAMVAGLRGDQALARPVDSVFLAQGALSCWAYTPEIPIANGKPGYFQSIVQQQKIRGPWVTTQSKYDTAVGKAYRLASTSSHVSFATPGAPEPRQKKRPAPADGSLGTFGIQGPGLDIVNRAMLAADADYGFQAGKVYNLESSEVISEGRIPFLGAHCDIAKPEVAHAFWSAIKV